jgi:predicted GIY-YIG superfamily endonuclease
MNLPVFMYVIGKPDGPVKVGITANIGSRLAALRTACPFPIELIAYHAWESREKALRQERIFHDVHADVRLAGEWFDMDGELAEESVRTSVELDEYFSRQASGVEGMH